MNPFTFIYTELLFRPLFNLLVGIANILPTHDIGLAIIIVTLAVRFILLPLSLNQARHSQKNQTKMAEVQKELKKIKDKHKDNKQKQSEETMKLYREAGINPARGCLPLLVQLPILIALYRVFLTDITPETFQYLYSFVSAPETFNLMFLGVDLSTPSLRFAIVAGIMQFIQARFFMPSPNATPQADDQSAQLMASMQKNMAYVFPAMTIFIAIQLPAALPLYWIVSTLFGVLQQLAIRRTYNLSSLPPAV